MLKIKWEKVIPVIFLLFASFIIGFITPDVRANGIKDVVASVQLIPQRMEAAISNEKPSTAGKLEVIDTYSTILDKLKTDYYYGPINEQEVTYDAIRGVLSSLGDPYTRFMDPDEYKKMREDNEGNFTGIGARLDTNKNNEVFIKEPMENTPAMEIGIKSNDVILAVDDKSIAGMDIEEVVKMIRGPEGTKVKLTIRRPGVEKPIDFVITRKIVEYPIVKYDLIDKENKIGYLRLYQFNEKSDTQVNSALDDLDNKKIEGLVFDLRGNPGGLLNVAIDISSRFVDSGPVVIIQERGGQRRTHNVNTQKHNHRKYPVVVLVDKRSASASEIVSGAIKESNSGTIVGTTTFGKGRVQSVMQLKDGSAVAITTAKYLTPAEHDIHHKGIEPDYYIESNDDYDPNDYSTDIQLMRAIDVLKVKMGLLPKTAIDDMKKPIETAKNIKINS
ncbi:MAG: S41 family peptidase [Armatimonadota bacterium]